MTAPTTHGFDGPVNEVGWVYLTLDGGGTTFAVSDLGGYSSWRVTQGDTGTRGVNVATGRGSAHGVQAQTVDVTALNHDAVTSGTVRYDLVALRFDWSANTVTPVIVKGGSTRALPPTGTGSTDRRVWSEANQVVDLPLALVKLTSGSSIAVVDADLRVWQADDGICVAFDVLALDFMNRIGTAVRIGDTTYTRTWDNSGSPVWAVDAPVLDTGPLNVTLDTTKHTAIAPVQFRRVGSVVEDVRGRVKRPSGWPASAVQIAPPGAVPPSCRPTSFTNTARPVVADDGTPGYAVVGVDGAITIRMQAATTADVFLHGLSGYRVD